MCMQCKQLIAVLLILGFLSPRIWGVTSRIHRHATFKVFEEGEAEGIIVESRGALRLGRSAEVLADDFNRAWSINSITVIGGSVYFGTSPNGGIYRYNFGGLKRIYPMEDPERPVSEVDSNDLESLTHEHVFATCTDISGRLVAAISGSDCRLDRFGVDGIETIFRPQEAQYIFAVTTDDVGHLYVGTGPEGKIYRLDALGKTSQLVYTCRDDNVLSLVVGTDGTVYAGSDERGLIYQINPRQQEATVLYDSPQPEVTALWFVPTVGNPRGYLYALATSAKVVEAERDFAARLPLPGRPEETSQSQEKEPTPTGQGQQFQIASQRREQSKRSESRAETRPRRSGREIQSTVWRVDPKGFVVRIADRRAVFFCMASWGEKILVGTGNMGQLLRIHPATEQVAVLYEDTQASQITAVATAGDDIYVGTANPARLVRLTRDYAQEGTYISPLIDARQPARWGRLQLDADLPDQCRVFVSCRSGNVEDANDPTFSPWTEPVEMTEPVPLTCPLGRFCQYKLILKTADGRDTPVIREVAVASSIPNLPPVVEVVDFVRGKTLPKRGIYVIQYRAQDSNDDPLLFTLYFRKLGRTVWTKLKEDYSQSELEWDSRTVEDGRYEIKVVANDAPANTPASALTASRISDPVVVDNTGPKIHSHFIENGADGITLGLVVRDHLSAVTKLDYTVNSNQRWQGAIPEDLVYDTTEETFRIRITDLESGPHVVAVRVHDDLGNTTYQSFDVMIDR